MSSEVPSHPPQNESKGLPPVKPPSGRFILQMFLVPGLIVLGAVLMVLLVGFIRSEAYKPESFLKKLDSSNPDVRWRGASDLAQVLKREESVDLKTNVKFALDLAERLGKAINNLVEAEAEKQKAELPKVAAEAIAMLASPNGYGSLRAVATINPKRIEDQFQWNKLAPERKYVQFLAAAMGEFMIPVGAPLLCELAFQEYAPDAKANILRRRQAVWALGLLGNNITKFETVKEEKQKEILTELAKEGVKSSSSNRAIFARNGLGHLKPGAGDPAVVRVDRVLAKCALSEDRFLRSQVALALLFWDGPLVEPTLLRLANDDGFGVEYAITDRE